MIESYQAFHALAEGEVVRDAHGQVWAVTKYKDETWLCPFSDEYSFAIRPDGTVYALGVTPALPMEWIGTTTQ